MAREPLAIQRDDRETPDNNSEEMNAFIAEASGVDETLDLDEPVAGTEPAVVTEPVAKQADTLDDTSSQEPDQLEAEIQATQTAQQTQEPVTKPQEPAPGTETSETVQPQAPAPAATAPQHDTSVAQAEQDELISQEQVAQIYKEWRGTTEDLLANHHYALTEEQIQELEVDPAKGMARMASKVYLDAVTAAVSQITSHLPRMMRIVMQQNTNFQKSEDSFFDRWKELNTPEGKQTVINIGQVWRRMHPSAPEEQFINEVGAQAMVALRLNPSFVPQPTQVNGNGNEQPKPFVPMAQTPQSGAPVRRAPSNPWEALNAELDAFEEEIDAR